MEQLGANGITVTLSGTVVEPNKGAVPKTGAKKPSIPKVKAKQPPKPRGRPKKSSDPVQNLSSVKKLLSGCLVTVSVSQSVTETPQELMKDEVSQPGNSHQDEFLDWLTGRRRSKYHPPAVREGRVGLTQYDSLDLYDKVDPASESTDEDVDKVKVDKSYTTTVEVYNEPNTW